MNVEIVLRETLERNGESMVGAWFAAVGDRVEAGAPLLEISTGKTTIEIASPASGVLAEQVCAVGDPVREGDLLGRIAAGAGGVAERPRLRRPPRRWRRRRACG